ncbi:hypothetical protein [Aeromicrobium sp. CTD01-1L150]|uniref:hypothetical protein n=1 Tax=Aeromicrobium sp. CTD01-1L150 TaxID=3341830 RepID=UPI0035C0C037
MLNVAASGGSPLRIGAGPESIVAELMPAGVVGHDALRAVVQGLDACLRRL